jgi:hypothetical protein
MKLVLKLISATIIKYLQVTNTHALYIRNNCLKNALQYYRFIHQYMFNVTIYKAGTNMSTFINILLRGSKINWHCHQMKEYFLTLSNCCPL